jgi:translocation and assembly module TamB
MRTLAKSIIEKIGLWTFRLLYGAVILAGLIFLILQTGPGKRSLVQKPAQLLARAYNLRIQMGNMEGLIPFECKVDSLSVSDPKGSVLKLKGLTFEWSPGALIKGEILIRYLDIAHIQFIRRPERSLPKMRSKKTAPESPLALPPVHIGRFSLGRLVLEKQFLGERAVLSIRSSFDMKRAMKNPEAHILVRRLDKPGAFLDLRALFEGSGHTNLSLSARLKDPDGMAFRALGLNQSPGPLNISLEGKAPLNDWQGLLVAEAPGIGRLRTSFGWKEGKEGYDLFLSGLMDRKGHALPKNIRELVPDGLYPIDIKGHFLPDREFAISALDMEGGWFLLSGSGKIRLKDRNFEARLNARIRDLGVTSPLIHEDIGGAGDLKFHFKGPLRSPEVKVLGTLYDFEYASISSEAASLDLQLKPETSPEGRFKWGALGKGRLKAISFRNGAGLWPDRNLDWALDALISDGPNLKCRSFLINGETAEASFAGQLEGSTGHTDGTVRLGIADISQFSKLLGKKVEGRFHALAKIRGNIRSPAFHAQIEGKISNIAGIWPSELNPLLGKPIEFQTETLLTKTKTLSIKGFRGFSENLEISGDATLKIPTRGVTGTVTVKLSDLAKLSVAQWPLAGPLTIETKIIDSLENPHLDVHAHSEMITAKGIPLRRFNATLRSENWGKHPFGNWDFQAETPVGHVGAGGKFTQEAERIELSGLFFDIGGNRIEGTLSIDPTIPILKGNLRGSNMDLSGLSPVFKDITGGKATLDTWFSRGTKGQKVTFHAKGIGVTTSYGKIASMDVRGDLKELFKGPKGKVKLSVNGFIRKNLQVERMVLSANGNKDHAAVQGEAAGTLQNPFSVDFKAAYRINGSSALFQLDSCKADWGDHELGMGKPLIVNLDSGKWTIGDCSWFIDKGRVLVQGWMDDAVSLNASFTGIPLDLLPESMAPALTGKMSGNIALTGTKKSPRAEFLLDFRDLIPREGLTMDVPVHEVSLKGDFKERQADLRIFVRGFGETPIEGTIRFPAVFSLSPMALSLPEDGAMKGALSGVADLSILPTYLGLEDHVLSGKGHLTATLNGTMHKPSISGSFKVSGGKYENLETGTILKNLEVLLGFSEDRVLVESFRANDGESGSLECGGNFRLIPSEGFPFKGKLAFMSFRPLRRDDLMVEADADLDLQGNASHLDIRGSVRVNSAELRLPDKLPPDVAQVERIDRNDTGIPEKEPSLQDSHRTGTVTLNVRVEIPGRMFVRGNGLESEWKGDLRLSNTLEEPVLKGALSVVRGFYDLFGKRFVLKDGGLLFSGPSLPSMDVTAGFKGKDITANVRLHGNLHHLDLELSSDPPLASDEILSRILFGKETARITPVQALRLAQAADWLAGGKSVFDPLDRARNFLGVDRLDVRQEGGEDNQTTLSVGKYVREDVYLEVEKGTGDGSGKVSVEVELTPNISLESEAKEDSTGGLGINWKWDY